MENYNKNKQLIANIEKLRKEMIAAGMKNGLECPQVISISKKLDMLIYECQNCPNCCSNFQKFV